MNLSDEVLYSSRRDRWAAPLAMIMTSIQILAGLISLGWYYFFVPRTKKILDDFGMEISQYAALVIRQSDLLVNYWYVALIVGIAALAIDFLVIHWLTKELGMVAAIAFGVCGAAIPLTYMGHGHYILHSAMAKIPL